MDKILEGRFTHVAICFYFCWFSSIYLLIKVKHVMYMKFTIQAKVSQNTAYHYLSYDVASIRWITSCHKIDMTTGHLQHYAFCLNSFELLRP